jgi:hypothetical protein
VIRKCDQTICTKIQKVSDALFILFYFFLLVVAGVCKLPIVPCWVLMTSLIDCGVLKNCSMTSRNIVDGCRMEVACFSEMMTPTYHAA